MKHIQFSIIINENYQEPLIAELEEMGFNGYRQSGDELIAYILQKNLQIDDRQRIDQLLAAYPGNNFIQTEEIVEEQNWNRKWEQTIQPQVIGQFLVKPTWAPQKADEGQIVLEIDPKMAFGTGYHATTRLMLQMLPQFLSNDMAVLDAGTGTGILAIAAAKLGCKRVIAFDNETRSVNNAKENILINKTAEEIEIREGSIETVKPSERFDLITANINRNAIIGMLPSFYKMLSQDDILLLSGLLKSDEGDINDQLTKNNLSSFDISYEDDWMAAAAKKT